MHSFQIYDLRCTLFKSTICKSSFSRVNSLNSLVITSFHLVNPSFLPLPAMAPDVTVPLPNVSSPSRPTDNTTDPIDNNQQTSTLPSYLPPKHLSHLRFYPIFDPPDIKLQRLAKEKAAAMAQFDDKLCTALFDDDNDLPLSNNIKASVARFASLCDDESFPTVSNIPDPSIHTIRNTLTQAHFTLIPTLSPGTNPSVTSLSNSNSLTKNTSAPLTENTSAPAMPIGASQGTTMSPHQFIINLRTASSVNAPDLPERAHDERQDHTSFSDSDSLTDNTSALTMPSLYEEQIESLQLENDLLSLDSSHMEETDDWDTEVTYNRLNYLPTPTNSAPPNDTHDTFAMINTHEP